MLKIRYKNNKYNAVWLVEPMITIGRSATNDLVIDDASVADKHLEIHVSHETLTLKNLQPLKPVKVNQNSVTGACTLKENDEILIGGIDLLVVDPKRESKLVTPDTVNATQLRGVPASGWALKANHVTLANRIFPLKDITVIGRSAECDICLAAAHLSRRHAQLQITDGALYVKDLGSANGTFLNGKQVMEARVKRGDELRFDTMIFGVMGPADELAKTTVRAVPTSSVPNATVSGTNTHASKLAQTALPTNSSPTYYSYKDKKNIKEEPKNTQGKLGLIFFAILAFVVVVALLVKH